ncbi:hypothetical protein [Streptomyces longisporoflavus]|uniref:Uncharacterized protein n=1 Tax=Streptomyces longisporoflavus TaxID=28044 RepID=A0ABW7QIK0_9ACTN
METTNAITTIIESASADPQGFAVAAGAGLMFFIVAAYLLSFGMAIWGTKPTDRPEIMKAHREMWKVRPWRK